MTRHSADSVVIVDGAGGLESMTNAPHLMLKAHAGTSEIRRMLIGRELFQETG